jgi:hypothetical protein
MHLFPMVQQSTTLNERRLRAASGETHATNRRTFKSKQPGADAVSLAAPHAPLNPSSAQHQQHSLNH